MMVGATKFNCKIELSKNDGIVISIRDFVAAGASLQEGAARGTLLVIETKKTDCCATITQTEKSLTTEVKDSKGSTKIEQGPEEVKITCKTFTVDAETVTVTSKADTTLTASGAFSATSTKDMALTSQAKCDFKSTAAMTLDATGKLTVKSAAELAAQAPKVGLTADASFDVKSSGALNLKGGAVSVKGDMRAELDSPSTTVGSTMTTVSGQIVSISGSLVKLG
ncbi:MAG: hypothetical protein QM784_22050 [Polyangiaceae bacterium]